MHAVRIFFLNYQQFVKQCFKTESGIGHINHIEVLLQQLESQIQAIPLYFYYATTFLTMFTSKYSDRKQLPDYKKNNQHLLNCRLFVLVQ